MNTRDDRDWGVLKMEDDTYQYPGCQNISSQCIAQTKSHQSKCWDPHAHGQIELSEHQLLYFNQNSQLSCPPSSATARPTGSL